MDSSPEFDTNITKCLISLKTVSKFPLQQAQSGIWLGLSELCRHQQFDRLAAEFAVPLTAPQVDEYFMSSP